MSNATKPVKKIGVWLDHASALLVNVGTTPITTEKIQSRAATTTQEGSAHGSPVRMGNFRSSNNEHHAHQREQDHERKFFKEIKEELLPFDEILITGPTTAQEELLHVLQADAHFREKKMTMTASDYETEEEVVERVKKFFA